MAAPLTPTTRGERHLALLEQERKDEVDARQAVWVFLWTLFIFKIVTVGIIWYVAKGSHEAQALIYATTWFWLIIPAAALGGPVLYWRRLRKQRRRREALRRSEWEIGPSPGPGQHTIVILGDDRPG
jgi:fatty acid desaturase